MRALCAQEEREKELRDQFERLKQERQKKYAGVNLYVKNLADNMDDERLREEFSKYGEIASAKVMTEPSSGKTRGFGFVCFATPEEATKAVSELNGKMVEGKPLYVALAQRKEVRRAQLEAQYAAHANKMAMGPPGAPGMFGGPGAPPMFYAAAPGPQGHMQRVPMYPQQMGMPPRRGWNPQVGAAPALLRARSALLCSALLVSLGSSLLIARPAASRARVRALRR